MLSFINESHTIVWMCYVARTNILSVRMFLRDWWRETILWTSFQQNGERVYVIKSAHVQISAHEIGKANNGLNCQSILGMNLILEVICNINIYVFVIYCGWQNEKTSAILVLNLFFARNLHRTYATVFNRHHVSRYVDTSLWL